MKNLLFSFILVALIASTSCNKKEPCDQTYRYYYDNLWVGYKTVLPYSGTEMVRYLRNNTDTLTFKGQGVDSGYVAFDESGGSPDCPNLKVRYAQYFHYRYLEKNGKDSFEVFLYSYVDYGAGGPTTDIVNCNFSSAHYYDYITKVGTGILDSTFGNEKYQNLIIGYSWFQKKNDLQNVFYVNRSNGFVHIKTPLNYYTLIK